MDDFENDRNGRDWLKRPGRGGGRPSLYSRELALFITGEVAKGYSLESIAKLHPEVVPCAKTLRLWTRDPELDCHDEFMSLYMAAKATFKDAQETAANVPYVATSPGRPTQYSAEIAAAVCERIANGETLADVVMDRDMPSYATFKRWLQASDEPWNHELQRQFESARLVHADFLADQIVRRSRQGATRTELMALMWSTGKMAPERYGDRVQMALAPPSVLKSENSGMSDDEMLQLIMASKETAMAAEKLGHELKRAGASKASDQAGKTIDVEPSFERDVEPRTKEVD